MRAALVALSFYYMRNYTEQVRKEVDSDFCFYCGKYIKSDKTLDHIIPVSKGGKDEVSNLVVCCHDCNTIKDNYTIPQLIIELEKQMRWCGDNEIKKARLEYYLKIFKIANDKIKASRAV
jgi:hypothetical protein